VPELPPAVRLCDGEFGCARQAPAALQSRRLRHPLREAEVAAGGREMPQSGDQLRAAGRLRRGDERHRMRQEDDYGKGQAVAPVQVRITHPPAQFLTLAKGRGNGGPMERVENPKQVSHSHRPLEISPTPRDSHIPTARLRPGWKSGKPETGFPLSHAGLATTITFSIQPTKTQKVAWPGTPVHTLRFHAHSALEPNRTFMLILRLENAACALRGLTRLVGGNPPSAREALVPLPERRYRHLADCQQADGGVGRGPGVRPTVPPAVRPCTRVRPTGHAPPFLVFPTTPTHPARYNR